MFGIGTANIDQMNWILHQRHNGVKLVPGQKKKIILIDFEVAITFHLDTNKSDCELEHILNEWFKV